MVPERSGSSLAYARGELWTHTGILPDPPEISGTHSDYEEPIVFISSIVH
jgi:hypothetical protein